jgi:carbon monoxide dehydrogenase subunit G
MKIENSFHVPAGMEESWKIITDVPSLVSCMPGAELTEAASDGAYRGLARVKIGPVQLQFNGEARLYDVDPRAHTMKVRSRASDAKGRGTVASEMAFALAAEGERTRVDVLTDLTLTGAVAQYGRGAGLIKEVANQFTKDFAANLEKMVLTKTRTEAKPLSGVRLLLGALRAMVGRWLGGRRA